MEGLLWVIDFVDGLQKVREFSGGFVEGLWVCEAFIESLVQAYEGNPPLWSCGLGPVMRVL